MEAIEVYRGRTFEVPGEFQGGDDFTPATSLTCKISNKEREYVLTVTKTGAKSFQIYASADATAAWVPGVYSARLDRIEAAYFPNGDPFVHGPETFMVRVV